MKPRHWSDKAFVAISTCLVLIYCVIVLAFVATVPDLRLRVLLKDEPEEQPESGIIIREVPWDSLSRPATGGG